MYDLDLRSSVRSGRTDNLLRERNAIAQADRQADVIISYVNAWQIKVMRLRCPSPGPHMRRERL